MRLCDTPSRGSRRCCEVDQVHEYDYSTFTSIRAVYVCDAAGFGMYASRSVFAVSRSLPWTRLSAELSRVPACRTACEEEAGSYPRSVYEESESRISEQCLSRREWHCSPTPCSVFSNSTSKRSTVSVPDLADCQRYILNRGIKKSDEVCMLSYVVFLASSLSFFVCSPPSMSWGHFS